MPNMPVKKPMPAQAQGTPMRRGPAAPVAGTPVRRGPAVAPVAPAPAAGARPFKKGGFVPFGKGGMPVKKGKKGC